MQKKGCCSMELPLTSQLNMKFVEWMTTKKEKALEKNTPDACTYRRKNAVNDQSEREKREKRTFRLIRNRKLAFLSCNPRNVFRMRMKMNSAETDIITNKWRKFNFTLSLARFHSDVWANELNVIEFFFFECHYGFFLFFFCQAKKNSLIETTTV